MALQPRRWKAWILEGHFANGTRHCKISATGMMFAIGLVLRQRTIFSFFLVFTFAMISFFFV